MIVCATWRSPEMGWGGGGGIVRLCDVVVCWWAWAGTKCAHRARLVVSVRELGGARGLGGVGAVDVA